jgi:hypothetical protein
MQYIGFYEEMDLGDKAIETLKTEPRIRNQTRQAAFSWSLPRSRIAEIYFDDVPMR